MYLHLGQSVVVADQDIIGIFDLDITSQSIQTRRYLNAAEQEHKVINVSDELPKSFVVTSPPNGGRGMAAAAAAGEPAPHRKRQKRQSIYLSQLSTQTLYRRTEGGAKRLPDLGR